MRLLVRAYAAASALAVAVLLVLGGVLVDQTRVADEAGLARVELGLPWPWVVQDQRSSDPDFPTRVGLASPWEKPMSASLMPFLADVALVVAVLVGLGWVVGGIVVAVGRRR